MSNKKKQRSKRSFTSTCKKNSKKNVSSSRYLKGVNDERLRDFLKSIPMKSATTNALSFSTLWSMIDWSKTKELVFEKQVAIYQAQRKPPDSTDLCNLYKLQNDTIRNPLAKMLAVRRVSHESQGKRSAGVDGKSTLNEREKFALASVLQLDGNSQPIRRVFVSKPGTSEKRSLGVPTMEERAKQALAKLALEPEWEAKFEATSYGFRPGKSAHNAIWGVWNCLNKCSSGRWVIDADIEKCFDSINHEALLRKLARPADCLFHKQISSWLTAKILQSGSPFPERTERGTIQGGVLSPLLANIALDGMIEATKAHVQHVCGKEARKYMHFYRYADDFVIIGLKKDHLIEANNAVTTFLESIGLNTKQSKTRLIHTLDKSLSDNGTNIVTFLGMNFRHHTAQSKFQTRKINRDAKTSIFLEVSPSDQLVDQHFQKVRKVIQASSSSTELVLRLSPIIRGWANYVSVSNARTTRKIGKWNTRLYLLLKNWSKKRLGTTRRVPEIWTTVRNNNWRFYGTNKYGHRQILPMYDMFSYSVMGVKMVKGERSPFDGDIRYWSERLASYSLAGDKTAKTLKRQGYICPLCKKPFFLTDEVIYNVDHITRRADGGGNDLTNLQVLHPWCHEIKTAKENTKKTKNTQIMNPSGIHIK